MPSQAAVVSAQRYLLGLYPALVERRRQREAQEERERQQREDGQCSSNGRG